MTAAVLGVADKSNISQTKNRDVNSTNSRINDAVKQAVKKEEKYAKEQKFYGEDEYDFKSAKINPESLKSINAIEIDMNHTDDWGACEND